jgi:DNA polymerase-4
MTQKIAFELRNQNKLTGCITVKLRYSNFDTVSKQVSVPYTCSDHMVLPKVKDLFNKLYDRRMLIRLIGVRFSNLIPGNYQIDLFQDSQETINLYKALDSVNHQYGRFMIMRASGLAS